MRTRHHHHNGPVSPIVTWLIWGGVACAWLALLAGLAVGLAAVVAVAALYLVAASVVPARPSAERSGSARAQAPILCEVVTADQIRVGDLLDGWLRVEMVEAGVIERNTIHMVTRDGQMRVAAQTRCFVLRSSLRAA